MSAHRLAFSWLKPTWVLISKPCMIWNGLQQSSRCSEAWFERQECGLAATALLVTGEDPESADGRRLMQVVAALRQVRRSRAPGCDCVRSGLG